VLITSHRAHAIVAHVQHPEFTVKSKLMKRVMPYVFPEDLPADQLAAAKVCVPPLRTCRACNNLKPP